MSAASPWADWLGRTETQQELIAPAPLAGLVAAIGSTDPVAAGDLPITGHWLYHTAKAPAAEVGEDGHPKRGGFMPDIPLPRRMFAAATIERLAAFPVGATIRKTSRIVDIVEKEGRSGRLVFVGVEILYDFGDRPCRRERQTIVYRDLAGSGAGAGAPAAVRDARWHGPAKVIVPDPVLLFRFSALTFNGHRIHYDRPYATQVEGYPDLVVQGPLIATLLAAISPRALGSFHFRALAPAFCGRPLSLQVRTEDGQLAFQALDEAGGLIMTARGTEA